MPTAPYGTSENIEDANVPAPNKKMAKITTNTKPMQPTIHRNFVHFAAVSKSAFVLSFTLNPVVSGYFISSSIVVLFIIKQFTSSVAKVIKTSGLRKKEDFYLQHS